LTIDAVAPLGLFRLPIDLATAHPSVLGARLRCPQFWGQTGQRYCNSIGRSFIRDNPYAQATDSRHHNLGCFSASYFNLDVDGHTRPSGPAST
jgi:hypothetical protein